MDNMFVCVKLSDDRLRDVYECITIDRRSAVQRDGMECNQKLWLDKKRNSCFGQVKSLDHSFLVIKSCQKWWLNIIICSLLFIQIIIFRLFPSCSWSKMEAESRSGDGVRYSLPADCWVDTLHFIAQLTDYLNNNANDTHYSLTNKNTQLTSVLPQIQDLVYKYSSVCTRWPSISIFTEPLSAAPPSAVS